MTDEARLERLTALAKRVWPDRNVSAVVGDDLDEIGAGIIADADEDWAQLVIVENHPRALDALGAALHVLAGGRENFVPSFRYFEVFAECSAQRDRADAEKARADGAVDETWTLGTRLEEAEERADAAEAERDRLRALFDDAGQGEHNVLALVDHYQDCMLAAERGLRDFAGALREMAGRWRDRSFHANAMHGSPPTVYDCASELLHALEQP